MHTLKLHLCEKKIKMIQQNDTQKKKTISNEIFL